MIEDFVFFQQKKWTRKVHLRYDDGKLKRGGAGELVKNIFPGKEV